MGAQKRHLSWLTAFVMWDSVFSTCAKLLLRLVINCIVVVIIITSLYHEEVLEVTFYEIYKIYHLVNVPIF